MTPYALAFTVYRIIAILLLLVGIYEGVEYLVSLYLNQVYAGERAEVLDLLIRIYIPAGILYGMANSLAKTTVWKIKE